MAEVTDTTAQHFVENKIRPIADQMAELVYNCREVVEEWNARLLGNIITADPELIIPWNPGVAPYAGGKPLNGSEVIGVMYRCQEVMDLFTASNNTKLNSVLLARNPKRLS
jgi:hypothetical protein